MNRTLLALGLALPLLLAAQRLAPAPPAYLVTTGVTPERFWTRKAHWPGAFDLVLAGDSRVYRGLSPAAMRPLLADRRIANFGFPGCGLTRPYLEAAHALLDPARTERAIVLGVTPHSLTPHAARDNGFLVETRRPIPEAYARMYLAPVDRFFRPIDVATQIRELAQPEGRIAGQYLEEYHEDGWVASRHVPEQPDAALGEYRRVLEPVAPELIEGLVETVAAWARGGVRVFAFRPPTSASMVELEAQRGRFDEGAFVEAFQRAGGIWLRLDGPYHSYDGSHLRDDAARELSRDLAAAIAATR
jgi:hypothetical protein